jgi:hypothetical protein
MIILFYFATYINLAYCFNGILFMILNNIVYDSFVLFYYRVRQLENDTQIQKNKSKTYRIMIYSFSLHKIKYTGFYLKSNYISLLITWE